MTLKQLGDYALYGAAVTAFVMLLLYTLRSSWWSSRAGRTLWGWMAATAGVLGLNAVTIFSQGDWPGRFAVRLGLYSMLFLLNARWLVVIVRVQNDARRERALLGQNGGESKDA